MDRQDDDVEMLLRQFQPREPGPLPAVARERRGSHFAVLAAAAAAVVLGFISVSVFRPAAPRPDGRAIAEDPSGNLFVVSNGVSRAVRRGERIEQGSAIRTADGAGAVVALADGSRVEMRSHSEMALETVNDGALLRLNAGSIIVNAAKQPAGRHLYVSTRDVLVTVVGTVFLVNADEKGSDVAVIQGQVHVKQGAVEKDLHRGEQASSRSNPELAIAVKIGWSREAAAYLAMLHEEIAQSVAARQAAPQAPALPAEVPKPPQFEEASIKPCPKDFQAPQGMRGGGSNSIRLSPGRLDALCMTVATLIRTAYRRLNNNSSLGDNGLGMDMTYGLGMEDGTRVRGGPDWVRSEKYTIAAVTGSATDTRTLQNSMLPSLLESRFQLKTHIEVEEIPVYALTIAKGGLKMKRVGQDGCVKPPPVQDGPHYVDDTELARRRREYDSVRRGATPTCGAHFDNIGPNVVDIGGGAPFSALVNLLNVVSGQPFGWIANETDGLLIINNTGIPDRDTFNFFLEYAADDEARAQTIPPEFLNRNTDVPRAPNVFEALEKQLGLKLEREKGSREYIVIDHIERPSPN